MCFVLFELLREFVWMCVGHVGILCCCFQLASFVQYGFHIWLYILCDSFIKNLIVAVWLESVYSRIVWMSN